MSRNSMMGVRRAIGLMDVLTHHPKGCSFSELQRELGELPAPTLSRLLKVMIDEGWVRHSPAKNHYRMGVTFLKTAGAAVGVIDRGEWLQPVVNELAHQTGESAAFAELDGDHLHLLAKREMEDSWHYMDIGKRSQRFTVSVFAQACMGYESFERQKQLYAVADNPNDMSWKDFHRRLNMARKDGVLVDLGRSQPNATRIVAAVAEPGVGGSCVGSIGITSSNVSLDRETVEMTVKAVKQAAQKALQTVLSSLDAQRMPYG